MPPAVAGLDVAVLHNLVFDRIFGFSVGEQNRYGNIMYASTIESGIETVREGRHQVCFFVNPARIEEVRDVVHNGSVMPQKSTDFYPKILTGILNRRITW